MDVHPTSAKERLQRIGTSSSGRPILRIEQSPFTRVLDAAGLLVVAAGFVVIAVAWNRLPERIPVHFGFSGEPDRWGGKLFLIMLPIAALLYAGLGFLRRYPHAFNYLTPITETNAVDQYRIALSMITWLRLEVVALFSGLTALAVAAGLKRVDRLNPWFVLAGVGVILVTAGLHVVWHLRAK